jgi:hypothetical protein
MTTRFAISPEKCRHPGSLHSILPEEYKGLPINFSVGNSASQLRDTSRFTAFSCCSSGCSNGISNNNKIHFGGMQFRKRQNCSKQKIRKHSSGVIARPVFGNHRIREEPNKSQSIKINRLKWLGHIRKEIIFLPARRK